MFLFCYKGKNNLSLSIFCLKLPFFPQNAWFFFLKSKNGVLETFLKSNILCTKILGKVKFFLKSKNFLKSNVLKSKIHCTSIFSDPSQLWKLVDGILINKAGIWFSNIKWRMKRRGSRIYIENKSTLDVLGISRFDVIEEECFRENPFQLWKKGRDSNEWVAKESKF